MHLNNTTVGYANGAIVRAKVDHARRIIAAERAVEEARRALDVAQLRLEQTKANGPLNHV